MVRMCILSQDTEETEEFVKWKVTEGKVRVVCSRQRERHTGGHRGEKELSGTNRAVPWSWHKSGR